MINVPHRRRIELQKDPRKDKENVPPSLGHELVRKHKRVNRCNSLITSGKWTSEVLEEPMDAIENETTLLKKAIRH